MPFFYQRAVDLSFLSIVLQIRIHDSTETVWKRFFGNAK